ncbi:MAG: helix-turn-helix domain-containing protein [Pseudomonadota bacterium]
MSGAEARVDPAHEATAGASFAHENAALVPSANDNPAPPPDDADFAAIVLPPNISGARGAEDHTLHDWIRRQRDRGAVICSVCAGAFWLGHAGLLDGRPATTHWALEEEFRAAFPRAALHPERLIIDDNDIVTAGGLMAWVDLGLFLVERRLGAPVVTRTARSLLVDPRGREQRNYRSFRPPLGHGDAAILAVQHWMEGAVDSDLTVTALADRAGLAERTFLRRFRAATGLTPNVYVQTLRVEKARGLLERTRLSVSEICWRVGYRDLSAFGRVFRTVTGITPGEYRTRFAIRGDPHATRPLDA